MPTHPPYDKRAASSKLRLDPLPAARLDAFFGASKSDARKRLSARFVAKHHRWFRQARPVVSRRMRNRLDRLSSILGVERFTGLRVFDAGAGYGMNTLQMALAGASRVVAVDLRPERIEDLTQLTRIAGLDTVVPVLGDFAEAMRAHGPFDLVLCAYFLSHLNHAEPFLDLCRTQLRPGGRLYLVDDNNGLSPLRQLTVRGERWTSEFLHKRDHPKGFLHRRRAVADASLQPLPRSVRWLVRERCAWATRGMTVPQIQAYCRWLQDRRRPRPASPPFPYRDPENGIPEERLLNPLRIAAGLRSRNFDVTLFPAAAPIGGGLPRGSAAKIRRALAPEFELVATRRGRG